MIRKTLTVITALLLILISVVSCGQKQGAHSTDVTVVIGSAQAAAARSLAPQIPLNVARITLTVNGVDMAPITTVADTTGIPVFQKIISVPDGPGRRFSAKAEDMAGNVLFQGSTTTDISGMPVIVTINLSATPNVTAPFSIVNSSVALYDVYFGNGKYFAVGDFGTILTSLDGLTWQSQNLGISEGVFSVALNSNTMIFTGENGVVISIVNYNGANPTYKKQFLLEPLGIPILSLNGAAWSGTTFIAVGTRGNVLTSTDGVTWTNNASNVTVDMNGAIGLNGNLLAVGRFGNIIRSADSGVTWTNITSGTTADLYRVASNNAGAGSVLVTVGDLGTILRSTDLGLTWSPQTSGTTSALFAVSWNGTAFVAAGANGTVLTSPDGITWTTQTTTTINPLHGIYGTGANTVVVGASKTILTSADTVTWTKISEDMVTMMNGVIWTGTQFLTVGTRGTILTSFTGDAGTWTKQTSNTAEDLYIARSNAARIVAVGTKGTIINSPDGITWAAATVPVGAAAVTLRGLAWSGTQFIAVGDNGTVLSSPDGAVWTVETSGVTDRLNYVTWAGVQFVAVGDNGRIITSPDGITWTSQNSNTILRLNGVTWSTTQIVAVGDLSTIVKSNDGGLTWTLHTSATAADLLYPPVPHLVSVFWTGYEFLAVSTNGTILISYNGANWGTQMVSISRQLNDIAWDNNSRSIVAVGYNTILKSTPVLLYPPF